MTSFVVVHFDHTLPGSEGMADIILIGAGSQAKAIISAERLSGMKVCAIYDDDCRWGN